MSQYTKDPQAILDYGFNWSDWLSTGETIVESTWEIPVGLSKDSDSHDNTTTTVWLTGGVLGTDYTITNHIKTSSSPAREDDRSLVLKIRNR